MAEQSAGQDAQPTVTVILPPEPPELTTGVAAALLRLIRTVQRTTTGDTANSGPEATHTVSPPPGRHGAA